MVTEVYDEVGNVKQTISYVSSGNGIGQVSSVEEDRFGLVNSDGTATYTYTTRGDRATATLVTPNGTERWGYSDYIRVGNPEGSKFAFRTLTKLEGVEMNPTDEVFHYHFDSAGRLNNATFAMTKQSSDSAPYYDDKIAERRARAYYLYEPGGRLSALEHYWENRYVDGQNNETYTSIPILGQGYSYDAYKGLRTSATYYHQADGDNDWETEHTENYTYEAERDFLTGVHYTGGTPGTDWSYDPAGNRANSGYTYDNLNRILTSPNGGGSYDYDHDILGFRTWRNYGYSGVQRYLWDEVGRLKSCVGNSAGARYEYRADGMRIKKVEGLTIGWNGDEGSASGYYTEVMTLNAPTERYWYDGQMAHEEDRTFKVGSTTYKNITKYGLGARGLDYIHHWNDQTDTTTVGFPIYDGHGNMIATLARSGSSPYYSVGDLRLYDVWGSVRSGSSTGLPNQRYCANLGHRQDDESSLIYMRARYYEPGTGRFVSEDPARDGTNFYVYCDNKPVDRSDDSGESDEADALMAMGVVCFFFGALILGIGFSYSRHGSSMMSKVMEDYKLATLLEGERLPSEMMDDFMQRELSAQDMGTLGRRNVRTGGRLMGGGLAMIGAGLILKAFLYDVDLAFMGSNLSFLDFFEF